MKHTIIYLAAGLLSAAAMLTSCDYRLDDDNSGSIRFTAEAVSFAQPGVRTKATPVNTVSAFTDTYTSFKVNAYKGTTAKFTGGTSTYSNGEWNLTATDVKWWPDETLDFYALAFPETTPPMITLADEMVVIPSTKTAIFDYTFSSDSPIGENTPDIMFGYYSGTGTVSGNKRVAPLKFYHPFAAVKFKAGADLVGATVNSITITNVANGGTCTIAASNLATAGNSAISWTHDSGHIDYSNTYTAAITAADQQIGTDDQTFILIPQILGATAKLEVNLTVEANGVNKTVTLEASLNNLTFTAGTIHTFTINYDNIPLDFTEPNAAIVAYVPDEGTHIDDPIPFAKYGYLPAGLAFNAAIMGLVGDRTFTKVVFNRFGGVDDTTPDTIQIQEAGHEGAEIIYAHYEDGVVTVTTHANTIYLNADCSHMFEDMNTITEIQWGSFFQSDALTNISYMFKGCSSLLTINFTDVLVTTLVTDASHMFDGCTSLTSFNPGLHFYRNNMVSMAYMFNNCPSLETVNGMAVGGRSLTNVDHMFYNCSSLFEAYLVDLRLMANMNSLFENCSGLHTIGCYNIILPTSPYTFTGVNMFKDAFRSDGAIGPIPSAFQDWITDSENQTGLSAHVQIF